MSSKASDTQESAVSLIRQTVSPVLDKIIQHQTAFADEVLSVFEAFETKYREAQLPSRQKEEAHFFFGALGEYIKGIYEIIEHRYNDSKSRRLEDIFEEYAQVSKAFVEQLPLFYEEVQQEERFINLKDDSWRARRIKGWKRGTRRLKNIPYKLNNTFRKLFRKAPLPQRAWMYKVPLRNLTAHYYIEEFSLGLIPLLEKVYREVAITSQQLWQTADLSLMKIDHFFQVDALKNEQQLTQLPSLDAKAFRAQVEAVKKELEELQQELSQDLDQLLENIDHNYQYTYERVGTAELSAGNFSHAKLRKKRQAIDKTYVSFLQGWRNTLFALHDDWRIDEEFNMLCNHLLYLHFKAKEEANQKIRQAIIPQVNTAHKVISNAQEAIENAEVQEMEKVLQEQKKYIDLQLIRTIIPATIAALYRQAIPALMENIQIQAREKVEKLSDRRGLVKTNEYKRALKTSEIDYISPRQIVSFEILPNLKARIDASELKVSQELAQVQKLINEVGQVSYFNLDSALSVYEGEQENKDKARNIAMEGLQRALKGTEHILANLEEIYRHLDEDVHEAVLSFNNELVELKSNDYALELKLRVARAKALEHTRALKQKTLDYTRNALPYTIRYFRQNYGRAQQQVNVYRKQMGIESGSAEVSTEISDFLTETEKSIQQLPYVYQRLFSIKPLDEAVFYEERTAEIRMVQEAFQNWNKGRFASTVIIGEKGSGITTLINFFVKQGNQRMLRRCQLIRATTLHQIHTEEELLQYLGQFFPDQQFAAMEDMVHYFQHRKQPIIIIFENLEHFYLRKVGGFNCLKMLFELISKTNQKVFWLCSCTLYAWRYLDKTIRISDYFEYEVPLQAILNHQLQEVILKRHRVSGYALIYEPSLEDESKKKFGKMSEKEQQLYLEKEYFNDLNKITAGNFSIAQLFWLRSARRVTEETIYIGSLKDYDFSFVKSLPLSHVLTLHTLLLHDGLTESQYHKVADYQDLGGTATGKLGNSSLNLIQLIDDGFITRKEDIYLINPLLYRQVVNLLQTKNFLH
ncbi:hypothetical protein [Catalinimonas niigatensis]|uniref:hypothetical protein n=1 Tax=Catalinimonas niigatensis TaxID=1397264 RepID=UPI0026666E8C|nr:hypothetical protein [Catalinimonas niigatensis]WPP52709.1 hypothetical protein PZB72_09985 [Catalinimonas niigatensis]